MHTLKPSTFARASALLLLAAGVVVARPASALDVEGVHLDDAITVGGTRLVLNGVGVRHVTIFNVSVYVGALYLPVRTHDSATALDASTTKRFIGVFRRGVSHDQAREAFGSAVRASAGSGLGAIESEVRAFEEWLPEFSEGERLVVTFDPAHGTTAEATHATTTFHASTAFGLALFGVWVGAHHVDDGLRDGMLGTSH